MTAPLASQRFDVRHSAWWLSNKDIGKFWVGQTSSATDAIMEINFANAVHFATQNMSAHDRQRSW